jgi:hypothetical protein
MTSVSNSELSKTVRYLLRKVLHCPIICHFKKERDRETAVFSYHPFEFGMNGPRAIYFQNLSLVFSTRQQSLTSASCLIAGLPLVDTQCRPPIGWANRCKWPSCSYWLAIRDFLRALWLQHAPSCGPSQNKGGGCLYHREFMYTR